MTVRMADSINPADLPVGMDAYLGYVNGRWPDWQAIRERFPGKPVYGLSVFGSPTVGMGVDDEPGDYDTPGAVAQLKRELTDGVDRPIGYVSASQANGLLDAMSAAGVTRRRWRLLTAHYAIKDSAPWSHICGPKTCGLVREDADGTQWVDHGPYDESVLSPSFITAAPHPGPRKPPDKPAPKPPAPRPVPRPAPAPAPRPAPAPVQGPKEPPVPAPLIPGGSKPPGPPAIVYLYALAGVTVAIVAALVILLVR